MSTSNNAKKVLAIDLGASSGRAMLGTYDGNTIRLEEIHRFSNDPVLVRGTLYWDVLRLFHEIKQSLIKAKTYGEIESLAVDTWGVDFGLLDEEGNLLENPVHYRDRRTSHMLEKAFEKIDKETLYDLTGNQFMELNTAFQLLALKETKPELLKRANTMLLMPDLFHYLLSGQKVTEQTIATTTQLYNAKGRVWSGKVQKALGIPEKLFTRIIPSGTIIGGLSKEIRDELGVGPIQVVAVCGHDTQSALIAVPAAQEDFLFLSCGTWSIFGTELDRPIVNQDALNHNMTNEGAFGNKISFMKNIVGLWLIQESRRQWIREGKEFGFGDLEKLAIQAKPFQVFIDPDDSVFIQAGDVPGRIREYCQRTGQKIPQAEADIVCCINQSLAMKYRMTMEELMNCTKKDYPTIYMIGGGTQSRLLCQMTANACGRTVSAGPVEGTVFGNVAVQLIAHNVIRNVQEARELIRRSAEIEIFEPQDQNEWNKAYNRFKEVIKC